MLGIAATITAVIAVIIGSIWFKQRQEDAWRAFAAGRGMVFTPGGFFGQPSMRGEHQGLPLSLEVEVRGSGKHRHLYTLVVVAIPAALPSGLALSEEGFFSGVSRFFGSQDIQVGDAELDAAAMIKGTDEEAVRQLLRQAPARQAALKVVRYGNHSRVEEGAVKLLRYGLSTDSTVLVQMMDEAVAAARGLAAGAAR